MNMQIMARDTAVFTRVGYCNVKVFHKFCFESATFLILENLYMVIRRYITVNIEADKWEEEN